MKVRLALRYPYKYCPEVKNVWSLTTMLTIQLLCALHSLGWNVCFSLWGLGSKMKFILRNWKPNFSPIRNIIF
jgi:hypothetical protein